MRLGEALLLAVLTSACLETGVGPVEVPLEAPVTPVTDPFDRTGLELVDVIVVRADDGDSLRVLLEGTEERVRLLGINAPEKDECLGDESRQNLDAMVSGDVVLGLEPDSRDQFGRLLAHVFVDDLYVNEAQVSDGLAIVLSDANTAQDRLVAAQERAERSATGLWSAEACGGGDLVDGVEIVRIEANPQGPDEEAMDRELVEIANRGTDAVDLSGFVLRDESTANRFVFPTGSVVPAGETITVASGCDPTAADFAWCADDPVWNNGGDSALLLDPAGRVVDHLGY
ncbi:MAG: lamin tail domain-containing protein [Acidimicrobiia bacterium]|nr:lamin tail domain-containing protein [Acidimicrobiia bacterium]MDH4308548.1 lamin tail domain-containing protein [Acidimicrobiia bacterium]